MNQEQILVAHLNALLLAGLAAGLLSQRRYRLCRSFLVYTLTTLACNRLIVTWPDVFFTEGFWSFKESLYAVLTICIAAEIGLLTFARFARAQRVLIGMLSLVGVAALVGLAAPSEAVAGYLRVLVVLAPRGQAALLCLLAAVAALAAFYRIPIHPFHRSIMLGFGFYLAAFAGALSLVRYFGLPAYPYYAALDPAAYAASVGVWAWAAWRRAPEPTPGMRRLQPWAAS